MTQVEQPKQDPAEISLKELIIKFGKVRRYLLSRWIIILTFCFLGALTGIGIAIVSKPIYTASCSFVLEEGSEGSGLGQYSGLASLAGINIGGSSGLFQGENIIELYKSREMMKKTLLGVDTFNGKPQMLIERYIVDNKLREKWVKEKLAGNISFQGNPDKFNRVQDSLITDMVNFFNKKQVSVTKPNKKNSIFVVEANFKDELFAKSFVNNLVDNVNAFYVKTKTKKSLQSVEVLTRQRDSVRSVLDRSIRGVASAIDATPNANPLLLSLRVPSQKKQVDVQASTSIYAEIEKNLELAKISLRQETPLIQVIDKPVLPLEKKKTGKAVSAIIGLILAGFLCVFVLVSLRIYQRVMS